MEAILIKSIEKRESLLAADWYYYLITAELRVLPAVSEEFGLIACSELTEIARKLVASRLTKLAGCLSDERGVYYLSSLSRKEFLESATISNIVEAFKKEELDLQAEFTKLMDQALIAERLNSLHQGDKQ